MTPTQPFSPADPPARATVPSPNLPTVPQPRPARFPWLWPAIIVVSAAAAALVTFGRLPAAVRAPVVFWFLLVCPGMAYVRLLRLKDSLANWILAIALSLAINAAVGMVMVFGQAWSPDSGLIAVITISVVGAVLQVVSFGARRARLAARARRQSAH